MSKMGTKRFAVAKESANSSDLTLPLGSQTFRTLGEAIEALGVWVKRSPASKAKYRIITLDCVEADRPPAGPLREAVFPDVRDKITRRKNREITFTLKVSTTGWISFGVAGKKTHGVDRLEHLYVPMMIPIRDALRKMQREIIDEEETRKLARRQR